MTSSQIKTEEKTDSIRSKPEINWGEILEKHFVPGEERQFNVPVDIYAKTLETDLTKAELQYHLGLEEYTKEEGNSRLYFSSRSYLSLGPGKKGPDKANQTVIQGHFSRQCGFQVPAQEKARDVESKFTEPLNLK